MGEREGEEGREQRGKRERGERENGGRRRGGEEGKVKETNILGDKEERIPFIRKDRLLLSLSLRPFIAPSLTCTTLCASSRSLTACSVRGAVSSFSGITDRMSSRSTILRSSSCKDDMVQVQCYTDIHSLATHPSNMHTVAASNEHTVLVHNYIMLTL